ncbi:MAG: nitrous oxide-stimulated promoter family protein [Coriobacteriia bacterium]
MNERFARKMSEAKVRGDTRIVAGLGAIYCEAHHGGRVRTRLHSDAATLGVYGRRVPVLCEECVAHIRYAEARRAYCPKDPKPFCAHCDTHCYRADEAEWQRQMMRFAGPRSMLRGYALPGIRHALEARKWRTKMAAAAAEDTKTLQRSAEDKEQ